MTKNAIVSDTTSDIPSDLASKYKVRLADTYVHFGTDMYISKDLSMKKFNEMLANTDNEGLAQEYEQILKKQFPKAKGFVMAIDIVVATHEGTGCLLFLTY